MPRGKACGGGLGALQALLSLTPVSAAPRPGKGKELKKEKHDHAFQGQHVLGTR